MLLVISPPHKQIICSYILLHPSTFNSRIRLALTDLPRGRGAGATLMGDRPNTKGKRPGEEMTRTNAVVIALATELAATPADAARLPFEILAPPNQDAADGSGMCGEQDQPGNGTGLLSGWALQGEPGEDHREPKETTPLFNQQNTGGNYEGHAQDN
jgi:hypothetical protein